MLFRSLSHSKTLRNKQLCFNTETFSVKLKLLERSSYMHHTFEIEFHKSDSTLNCLSLKDLYIYIKLWYDRCIAICIQLMS